MTNYWLKPKSIYVYTYYNGLWKDVNSLEIVDDIVKYSFVTTCEINGYVSSYVYLRSNPGILVCKPIKTNICANPGDTITIEFELKI